MDYKTAKEILETSQQDEWIVDDETGSFTYKKDLNLRIERADYESYRDFKEPWANSHPDSSAKAIKFTAKYGNSFIACEELVSVDGHRGLVPMPKSLSDLRVEGADVNFAKIVDVNGATDEYLQRSGITVIDDK